MTDVRESPSACRRFRSSLFHIAAADRVRSTSEGLPSVTANFNRCRISQNFSRAGATSAFVARAMPTRSSDKRLRKYANLAAAAAPARV